MQTQTRARSPRRPNLDRDVTLPFRRPTPAVGDDAWSRAIAAVLSRQH
jgi:hypothetical protein